MNFCFSGTAFITDNRQVKVLTKMHSCVHDIYVCFVCIVKLFTNMKIIYMPIFFTVIKVIDEHS